MTSAPIPSMILALTPDPVSRRLDWIDRLRGLAVALMVLDHVLVQLAPGHVVRFTLTRWALPLFMICAATVFRRYSPSRWALLVGAAAVEALLFVPLGMGHPGILSVFVLVAGFVTLLGFERVYRYAAPLLVAGFLQALYLPIGWAGYEPGLVLGWFALGRLGAEHFYAFALRLPAGLASIGRRPLVWYLGHLAVLVPLGVLGA